MRDGLESRVWRQEKGACEARGAIAAGHSLARFSSKASERQVKPAEADDRMNARDDRACPPEPIPLGRCRELLGDEAEALSDDDVEAMRCHAQALAHVLVEIFLEARGDRRE